MIQIGDKVFVEGVSRSLFVWALSRRYVYTANQRGGPATGPVFDGRAYSRTQVSRHLDGRGSGVTYQGTCTLTLISGCTQALKDLFEQE